MFNTCPEHSEYEGPSEHLQRIRPLYGACEKLRLRFDLLPVFLSLTFTRRSRGKLRVRKSFESFFFQISNIEQSQNFWLTRTLYEKMISSKQQTILYSQIALQDIFCYFHVVFSCNQIFFSDNYFDQARLCTANWRMKMRNYKGTIILANKMHVCICANRPPPIYGFTREN